MRCLLARVDVIMQGQGDKLVQRCTMVEGYMGQFKPPLIVRLLHALSG